MSITTEVDHMEFWEQLARKKTHQTQIDILDALRRADKLSPAQFSRGRKGMEVGHAGYHFRALEGDGFVKLVDTRPVRGALEHFYALAGEEREAVAA